MTWQISKTGEFLLAAGLIAVVLALLGAVAWYVRSRARGKTGALPFQAMLFLALANMGCAAGVQNPHEPFAIGGLALGGVFGLLGFHALWMAFRSRRLGVTLIAAVSCNAVLAVPLWHKPLAELQHRVLVKVGREKSEAELEAERQAEERAHDAKCEELRASLYLNPGGEGKLTLTEASVSADFSAHSQTGVLAGRVKMTMEHRCARDYWNVAYSFRGRAIDRKLEDPVRRYEAGVKLLDQLAALVENPVRLRALAAAARTQLVRLRADPRLAESSDLIPVANPQEVFRISYTADEFDTLQIADSAAF